MEEQQTISESNRNESLQEIPLKTLAENVIKDYEKLLFDGQIINGSFKDIVDKMTRPFKRTLNWGFLVLYLGYIIPRLSFIGYLYLKDEETRTFWQCYLTDYFELLGMFGRYLNFCYLIFSFPVVLDRFWLYSFEKNIHVFIKI